MASAQKERKDSCFGTDGEVRGPTSQSGTVLTSTTIPWLFRMKIMVHRKSIDPVLLHNRMYLTRGEPGEGKSESMAWRYTLIASRSGLGNVSWFSESFERNSLRPIQCIFAMVSLAIILLRVCVLVSKVMINKPLLSYESRPTVQQCIRTSKSGKHSW